MFEVKHNFKNRYIKKFNESQVNEEAFLCPLFHYHVDNVENMSKYSTRVSIRASSYKGLFKHKGIFLEKKFSIT